LLSQAGNPSSHFVLLPETKKKCAGAWGGPPNEDEDHKDDNNNANMQQPTL
jgi:hypothetical protein